MFLKLKVSNMNLGLTKEEYKEFIQKTRCEVNEAIYWCIENLLCSDTKSYPIDDDKEEDIEDLLDKLDFMNGYDPVDLASWPFDDDDEPTRKIEIDKSNKKGKKCECGAEKVGSSVHSEYCPKYEKPEFEEDEE